MVVWSVQDSNQDTFPVGALVCITGDDFFATCAGNIGIVVDHKVGKMGDWNMVLVDGVKILARTDQLTLVSNLAQ